jgi:hypothetical protein
MMKLFGVAACIVVSMMIATQPVRAQAVAVGLKAGGTFSMMDSDPDGTLDRTSLTSFTGGPFLRIAIAGAALQIEGLAVSKGAHFIDDEADGRTTMKIDYIEVPVTLMVGLTSGAYAFFGPTFSFERDCGVHADIAGAEFDTECEGLFGEPGFERKSLDIGAALGVGYQLPLGPGMLLFEGRYTYGLTNLNDSSTSDTNKLRNRTWVVLGGYSITIGH